MGDDLWAAYRSLVQDEDEKEDQIIKVTPSHTIIQYEIDSDDPIDMMVDQLIENEGKEDYGPIRSQHEIPLANLPVGDIPTTLPEHEILLKVAVVKSNVGSLSLAEIIGKPVAPGSLLADANRIPVTRVLELFGPVDSPSLILKGSFSIGTELYAASSESVFPDPDEIAQKYKGCDASNKYDEPIDNDQELDASSDDEGNAIPSRP